VKIPKRVLIVHPGPQFSVHDVFAGWQEAFTQAGIACRDYNLEDRIAFHDSAYLYTGKHDDGGNPQFKKAFRDKAMVIGVSANGIYASCFQWWPDVVIIVSEFMDVLRSRGIKVVLLFTESPYEEKRQLERAAHADLVLLNDPLRIGEYEEAGIPAVYMPHAYRPGLHYPGPGEDQFMTDFVFVGTMFASRQEFFGKMLALGAFEGLDTTFGGNWATVKETDPLMKLLSHERKECVDNALTTRLYKSAKVGLNMFRRENDDDTTEGWAASPREIEMAACGLFFLRESRPESDELFGDVLPTYSSPEEAAELLRWWLDHDAARGIAAIQARARVRPRTFAANVQALLKALDEL
jgi:spore maturation protein CgeB